MLKLKTMWWHSKQAYQYTGWHSDEQRQLELERRQSKLESMQVQGCRAVVQGWPCDLSPALIFDKVYTAVKVEEFITRGNGKRGAIILSFANYEERNDAVEAMQVGGVRLFPAYSSRSHSNSWHRIRTHWQTGRCRRGG